MDTQDTLRALAAIRRLLASEPQSDDTPESRRVYWHRLADKARQARADLAAAMDAILRICAERLAELDAEKGT